MTDGSISGTDLPAMAHPNHGRTVAAWVTTVGISLATGAVLKALGHGQPQR